MHFDVITLFPELIQDVARYGVIGRAFEKGRCTIKCFNPRDYTTDRYKTVDDRPYGGGPGMVMMAEPLAAAIMAAKAQHAAKPKVIYLSPQGEKVTQKKLAAVKDQGLILVCGRYEGVDERLIETQVDEQWSIGDYVLAGGELPALVVIEAIVRLQPGVLGNQASSQQDSFSDGLLDCPHYTRPEVYAGKAVPEVLLSGNHAQIERWRLKQSLVRTLKQRPELVNSRELTEREEQILNDFRKETGD